MVSELSNTKIACTCPRLLILKGRIPASSGRSRSGAYRKHYDQGVGAGMPRCKIEVEVVGFLTGLVSKADRVLDRRLKGATYLPSLHPKEP